jgi:hypothetical protein
LARLLIIDQLQPKSSIIGKQFLPLNSARGRSLEQRSEARLLELSVAGQGVDQVPLAHDDEGDVIGQRPLLGLEARSEGRSSAMPSKSFRASNRGRAGSSTASMRTTVPGEGGLGVTNTAWCEVLSSSVASFSPWDSARCAR